MKEIDNEKTEGGRRVLHLERKSIGGREREREHTFRREQGRKERWI